MRRISQLRVGLEYGAVWTGYCCINGPWYLKTVMEETRVIWKFVTTFKHCGIS